MTHIFKVVGRNKDNLKEKCLLTFRIKYAAPEITDRQKSDYLYAALRSCESSLKLHGSLSFSIAEMKLIDSYVDKPIWIAETIHCEHCT